MRILVVDAPSEVRFAVQRGRSDLLEPLNGQHEPLRFEFSLRLGLPLSTGSVNFLGEFAQGPSSERFVYINSGTLAGQSGSRWTRRAKLKLALIPPEVVETVLHTGGIIEARVHGTMGDGGPVCASVNPNTVVWGVAYDVA
ncbi:DUF5990 family protein [Comamonas aquatilis]|uniref:DUF5990 family protein n=1 Tax=Comamonas aquatilis TaxID=1778406 RepID=UPI0039F115D5